MSDNYPVDGELRRQAERIEALETKFTQLAAKVEALRYQDDYSNSHWQDVTNGLANRIAALESTEVCDECVAAAGDMLLESPAPAPDPVCANCEHPANDHHSLCWHRLDSGDVCGCKAFVPTAGPAPLDPVRMNLSEVVLSYVSMCGVRAWDEYGGRMIEIFGDGQSIQSLYIKNDSRQEIADLILGRDGAR